MLDTPRTALFVPGDRPTRIANALSSGAEAVVVDLEDAVAESAKHDARSSAVTTLAGTDRPTGAVMVRCNGVATDHLAEDVPALVPVVDKLAAVVLPMVDSPEEVRHLDGMLTRAEADAGVEQGRTRIVATAETAAGVLGAREIAAASSRVLTLLFGSADLSHELGITPSAGGEELAAARSMVVLAAAAAGVARPVDGPYLTLDDEAGLETSAQAARRLGFGGKAVIHPAQLSTVERTFAPTPEDVAWAQEVDAAFVRAEREGRSAVRLADGTFVDYPVAYRARAILQAAEREATP